MQTPPLERLLIAYARHFPVQRGKLRVVNNLWRAAAGGGGTHRTAVLTHGGLTVPCDLTEMLQRQFYFFGTYFLERAFLAHWSQLAREARVVFDVGANAGIYSLAALAANPKLAVHAFEPTPEIAARLRETAAMNGLARLLVHETAVSDTAGEKTLRRFRGDGSNEGMNFVVEGPAEGDDERIVTDSLDHFCAQNGIERIDLLKMDIQGHEYAALKGGEGLLAGGRIGHLLLELNWSPAGTSDCVAGDCVELLAGHGYQFRTPDGRSALAPAGPWLRALSDVIAARPA